MPFDFSELTERRGSNSMKWDVAQNELPMWVADMDFRTAPPVIDAIQKKAQAGVFGYTIVPAEFAQAARDWWERRHGLTIDDEWVVFSTGVVPALSSIVRSMTAAGDNVLIQPPVYNIFTNSIVNNGRNVVTNDLVFDGSDYHIDFADLDRQLADPRTTMMIVCNPHNPVGRIWSPEELRRIAALCTRHDVLVVADEIHCDITRPGTSYTPFASVSAHARRNSVSCWAPTKAFNLAGLQAACIVLPDPALRARVSRGLNTDEVAEPNAFAIEASVAAFSHGEPWLEELRTYVQANRDRVDAFIQREVIGLRLVAAEATYLGWIDCSAITADASELTAHLRRSTGLVLSNGADYGSPGAPFMRMNLACPRDRLDDGLRRLRDGVASYRPRP